MRALDWTWAALAFAALGFVDLAYGQSTSIPEVRPGVPPGYLAPEARPNSLALLPAPPAAGSAAIGLDMETSQQALALRGTPRWSMAIEDADLTFPHAAGTFSCALQAPITEQDTPRLYMLLRRSLVDAGRSTYAAKDHYARRRPFLVNNQPICTPADETRLAKEGSFPSGHTTTGWAWALILSELAPDRMEAVLARGRAFGESRVVCNLHWESDVLAARYLASATVARLHADQAFLADLDAARMELAAVRAKGLPTVRDCNAESTAMALDPPRSP